MFLKSRLCTQFFLLANKVCTQICFGRFLAIETFFRVVQKNAFFYRENLSPHKISGSHDLSWPFPSAGVGFWVHTLFPSK
jgi:hypothetical protein